MSAEVTALRPEQQTFEGFAVGGDRAFFASARNLPSPRFSYNQVVTATITGRVKGIHLDESKGQDSLVRIHVIEVLEATFE